MVCYQSLLIVEDDPRQSCILFAYFQSMRLEDITIVGNIEDARKTLGNKGNCVDLIICSGDHKKLTKHLDETDYQGAFILLSDSHDAINDETFVLNMQKDFNFEGVINKPLTKQILDKKFSENKAAQTIYNPNLSTNITPAELNDAIVNNEIVTLYQPRLDLKTGNIVGAKAHIRWHSLEKGFVSPLDFIPVAAKTGLIFDLTFSMLTNIGQDIKNGGDYWRGLKISISLPLAMLRNPQLADDLKDHMKFIGVDCSSIILEIDGDITNNLVPSTILSLQKLALVGFELALKKVCTKIMCDSTFRSLPFSELNIDRSVVNNILTDVGSQETLRTNIALARELGWRVSAEGIETQGIFDLIKELGTDYAQGYFISKPLPANYITQTLGSIAA